MRRLMAKKFTEIKKATALLLAGVMTVTVLSGCAATGQGSEATKVAETTQPVETITATETENSGEILFTDAAGREIRLKEPAKKIVSGYYITTSMLIALGMEDQIVGIEAKADKRPIYKLAAPELIDLPNVGTAKAFDLEGCAALEPDLVILPKKLTEQADILAKLGITAMVVNPESEKELKETIVNIARATGAGEQGEKILTYYELQSNNLRALSEQSEKDGKAKPEIYFAGTSDVLRTAGSAMYQNEIIELAGGVNAAAEIQDKGWTNISYETILSYDPDMIVIIPEAEYTKEDVLSDAELQDLQAVKNNAVYEMPSDREAWDSPVTSGILGSLWLASIVHPEYYTPEDFDKDMTDFYQSFYGIEADLK